jgi:hypothetical protein
MNGNDPSATNPVYCRIAGVIRSITAALSVTKADATNWCNAGSTELATKEIDYFVYLGYNATDGVVVGFSRIPYACIYSDFSATTTNEKYCGISTITTAAAGDSYVNIGRFAATLSATAAFTWSVPTFTPINLIQRPIYKTRRLTWQPTYTKPTGLTATIGQEIDYYTVENDRVTIEGMWQQSGTSGTVTGVSWTFTLPFAFIAQRLSLNGTINRSSVGDVFNTTGSSLLFCNGTHAALATGDNEFMFNGSYFIA